MSEIVADIVREMREVARNAHNANMAWFAARIEAAYKRDIQTMVDAGVEDMQTAEAEATKLREENARLKKMADIADMLASDKAKRIHELSVENARLKAALKPVLEVGWEERKYNYCSGTVPTKDLVLVVRDAQRIYNGGEK